MKRIIAFLLVLVVCVSLCACAKDSRQTDANESKIKFTSVEMMKENVDGVWMNCQTGDYFIIKDGRISRFDEGTKQSTLKILGDRINDYVSFESFYSKYLEETGETIEYSFENGSIVLSSSEQVFFELHDNKTAFNDSTTMFSKDTITEDELKGNILEAFINLKYPNILTNKDVQFDKSGNLYKSFLICGTAVLDDYYNWGYKDYESEYFCVRVRPVGGSYSDEWYIYASRTVYNSFFETLKSGSQSLKIVAKIENADSGSDNMATLIDFFYLVP